MKGCAPFFTGWIADGSALSGGAVLDKDRTILNRRAINPPFAVRVLRFCRNYLLHNITPLPKLRQDIGRGFARMTADQKKHGLENTSRPSDIVPFLAPVNARLFLAASAPSEDERIIISEANTTILV